MICSQNEWHVELFQPDIKQNPRSFSIAKKFLTQISIG